jgi:hypothetical protein
VTFDDTLPSVILRETYHIKTEVAAFAAHTAIFKELSHACPTVCPKDLSHLFRSRLTTGIADGRSNTQNGTQRKL